MILSVPDIRQADDFDCGAAAVDAVCAFFGVRQRGPVRLANRVQGMSPDTVAALFRALGFTVLAGKMPTGTDDLRHFTRAGLPVLCPITAEGDGHWVVVTGVERGRVHVQDPATGPRSIPAAAWLAGWRDTSESGHEFDRWGIVVGRA